MRRTPRRQRDIDRPILDLATHPTETVTPKVLADHQRCDTRTILKMVDAGTLHGYRVGRGWRITVESACRAFCVARDPVISVQIRELGEVARLAILEVQESAQKVVEQAMVARRRVNHLVEKGKLPHPSLVPCVDCGHIGVELGHEYDHHNGYDAEHYEDVVVRCRPCHRQRHAAAS